MMDRRPIPVAGLENYLVDSLGRVFRKGDTLKSSSGNRTQIGPANDRELNGITFAKAMVDWAGAKNGIDKAPWPLMPGVWQLRFGGDFQTPQFMGGGMQAYFERHAVGPDRVHPDEWPPWGEKASAAAAAFVDTARDAKCWFMIRLPFSNLPRSAARQKYLETHHSETDGSREHYPYLVMGKIAFAATNSSFDL